MNLIDNLLNIGVTPEDDIQKTRLIRQVNGLNLFYTMVAVSGGVLFRIFMPDSHFLQTIQIPAALCYIVNIACNAFKKLDFARSSTIIVFEIHVFFIVSLTNAWSSPVLLIIVLFPLLAALVEAPIVAHLFVGMGQFAAFFSLHYFFNGLEKSIIRFSRIDSQSAEAVLVMILFYVPIMATVIIQIIFQENLRAREKQKELLNQITIANKQLEIYAEKLKDESQRLLAEINIAKKIQTMVLPLQKEMDSIGELDVSFIMRPADEVGGDYYDVIKMNNNITIGIGDVTGHGLPSGLVMLMAQTAIRTLTELRIINPKDLIAVLNRVMYANINRIKENRNMTLSIITYCNKKCILSGQHESVIICRKDGSIENIDTLGFGFYVGLLPDIEDNLKTFQFELDSGDIVLLYTDGVTEAINEERRQFGLENLCELVKKYRDLPTQKIKYKIMGDLYNYMGTTKIYDDISLVIMKQK